VIFCTGQVYYDLTAAVTRENINDIAIVRVESLCPFPFKEVINELKEYKNASVTWAQEEHKNAGPWTYVEPRLLNILEHLNKPEDLTYVGRKISAATATGHLQVHNLQLEELLQDALS